jgi:ligand-binding sensor domain-containing protein
MARYGLIAVSLVIFMMTLAFPALALDSHPIADDYIRADFTVEDGLPDNVINAIVQTENGLLWVGTESGLASFNGRDFSTMDLSTAGAPPQGAVHSLLQSSVGDLWVGTDAGVVLIPRSALDQFSPAPVGFAGPRSSFAGCASLRPPGNHYSGGTASRPAMRYASIVVSEANPLPALKMPSFAGCNHPNISSYCL